MGYARELHFHPLKLQVSVNRARIRSEQVLPASSCFQSASELKFLVELTVFSGLWEVI